MCKRAPEIESEREREGERERERRVVTRRKTAPGIDTSISVELFATRVRSSNREEMVVSFRNVKSERGRGVNQWNLIC